MIRSAVRRLLVIEVGAAHFMSALCDWWLLHAALRLKRASGEFSGERAGGIE